MDTQITSVITLLVGSSGVFALIKYIISSNRNLQENFLKHLEIKNGHLERVAEKFNTTVEKFNETINNVEMKMEKNFDKNTNDHDKLFNELRNK